MTEIKQPTTFSKQIQILRSRGLVVDDEAAAISVLKRLNYYRFTAYTLTFKKNDVFYPGTTFEKIYRHYDFDSRLRILLLEIIEHIEIAFRTHIAYELGHKYGPLGYEDPKNFLDERKYQTFIRKLRKSLSRSKDPFVIHHRDNKDNKFPIWVAVEVLTFSSLSKLYKNLLIQDQKAIARKYYGIDHREISNWLHALTIVRNRCAHYSRLFNQVAALPVRFRDKDERLEIPDNQLFAVIFNLKYLTQDKQFWRSWVVRLETLVGEFAEVDIRLLGFKEDWYALISN